MAIRYRIRDVAAAKGITQTRLTHLAEIEADRLRELMRPDATTDDINITLVVLDRIAKALGVDASQLIESVLDEK